MQAAERDRLIVAKIAGSASRHAATGWITPDREREAVEELAAVADGRTDLLAQHAGICMGVADSEPDWPAGTARKRLEARLCMLAGADENLIPAWRLTGRQRAETARQIPYTGIGNPGIRNLAQ